MTAKGWGLSLTYGAATWVATEAAQPYRYGMPQDVLGWAFWRTYRRVCAVAKEYRSLGYTVKVFRMYVRVDQDAPR